MSNSKRRAYVKARMKELTQEREARQEIQAKLNDIDFLRNRYAEDPFMADYIPSVSLNQLHRVPVYDRVETYFVFAESRRSA